MCQPAGPQTQRPDVESIGTKLLLSRLISPSVIPRLSLVPFSFFVRVREQPGNEAIHKIELGCEDMHFVSVPDSHIERRSGTKTIPHYFLYSTVPIYVT